MLAEFGEKSDKIRVLKDGPRNFDRSIILVKEFAGELQEKNVYMKEPSFWVHVHDLPMMARNVYIGRLIGDSLGRFDDVDLVDRKVEWDEFMRIRVSIDITKPLVHKKRLNIGLPVPAWINFTYERLPDFCFWCGQLGHSLKECHLCMEKNKTEGKSQPYGNWLRAGPKQGFGGSLSSLR